VAHHHLLHRCHGHHIILTSPHQTIRCGVLSREEWLRLAATTTKFGQSCGRRLSHNYSKNAPTYVTEDMETLPFVCPASMCTYGFTGHVTKVHVIDSNQIMVACWSVYGDFSHSLYKYKACKINMTLSLTRVELVEFHQQGLTYNFM
jgi:hypothetical protein